MTSIPHIRGAETRHANPATKRRRTAWLKNNRSITMGMDWVLSEPKAGRWKRAMLPEHEHHIPRKPGCYAAYLDGILVYVGSTQNLHSRILNYAVSVRRQTGLCQTPWGSAQIVGIKFQETRKYGDWLMLEARLIRRLRPTANKRYV